MAGTGKRKDAPSGAGQKGGKKKKVHHHHINNKVFPYHVILNSFAEKKCL